MFRFPSAILVIMATALMFHSHAHSQGITHPTFWIRHEFLVADTQINQPHWATPLITVNARIEQGFRADFTRQTVPEGATNWNYGGAKGLQIIPFARTEFRISLPPFDTHSAPRSEDGFGDFALRLKYRLYGSNEEHHNTIITADLAASLPTGKNGNGSCCAIVTPAIEFGKGFSALTLATTLGATLPASNIPTLGRAILWNNAIQYHLTRLIWVEDEFNSTYYLGGKSDGKQQTFNTPGIIVSRIPLTRTLSITVGAGEQVALTHFNTYNHSPVFTTRFRF